MTRLDRHLRDASIHRGVDYLFNFIKSQEHFEQHWADYLFEFSNIRDTGDPVLSSRAGQVLDHVIDSGSTHRLELGVDPSIDDCLKFSLALVTHSLEAMSPSTAASDLLDKNRHVSSHGSALHQTQAADAESRYKSCYRNLILAYIGFRAGAPLGTSLSEALQRALQLRPYKSLSELGLSAFVAQGCVATHIVYVATDYNAYRIDPDLLSPERDLMLHSLDSLMAEGEVELLGECLDALRSCGVATSDARWVRAAHFLISMQNPDGSWGDSNAESSYKRYHVTLTAVQGLRDHLNQKPGPSNSWIGELLGAPVASRPQDRTRAEPSVRRPIDELSLREFEALPIRRDFIAQKTLEGRPAILRGAGRLCKAWNLWTDEYLAEMVGSVEVDVEASTDTVFAHPRRRRELDAMSFSDYMKREHSSGHNHYLAQVDLDGSLKAIQADTAFEEWLPERVSHEKKLWLSLSETTTPLHFDQAENLFILLRGRKRFTLFSPRNTALLYPCSEPKRAHFSEVDIMSPDLERFPNFGKAESVEVELGAGDALVLPAHWWHHVQSFGESLGVSVWWRASSRTSPGGSSRQG